MAEFLIPPKQHGHEFVIAGFELRMLVDIHQFNADAIFFGDRPQGLLHVVTEMAVIAAEQGQLSSHSNP